MRWTSTPESVKNGEPTVLAIAETVLAVAIYWGIAWYWDTHIHLLTSIVAAPLLLLRSPESTEKGVEWFAENWKSNSMLNSGQTPQPFTHKIWFLLPIIISIFVANELLAYSLQNHFEGSLTLHLILIGATTYVLLFSTMFATIGLGPNWLLIEAIGLEFALMAGIVTGLVAGIQSGIAAVAGVLTGVLLGFFLVYILNFTFVLFGVGIWLRSLIIRTLTTLCHPLSGVKDLPNNWRQLIWAVDSLYPPELVPNLTSRIDSLSIQYFLKDFRSQDWLIRLSIIYFVVIFFLPALLYRWSLKSTCWLYLPLVYMISDIKSQPEFLVSALHRSRGESARIWLAFAVILSTVVITFSISQLIFLKETYTNIPVPVYLWAFNLGDLAPWQWFSLVGATITWIIFFYVDRVVITWNLLKRQDEKAKPTPVQVQRLIMLTKLRSICSLTTILMALGYAGLVFMEVHTQQVPSWLSFLDLVYGPYLP
jgi:hypothetical protein